MIELRDVTKSYVTDLGRHFVFRGLTVTLPGGKNIGIIGPNGAGKSTLLRLIGKIDYPDTGEVLTTKRVSWPVGLSGGFQGSMTGRDNTRFVLRIYGVKDKEAEERIAFVQEFANIGKHFDLPVKTYSTGMRARLGFGLSMAIDFEYYLVDEITAVGDRYFRDKSEAMFREKKKKANIIMVSHNMKTLLDNCEVGLIINNGNVEFYDNIRHAIRKYTKN